MSFSSIVNLSVIYHVYWHFRLAHLVQLDLFVQTLQLHPLNALMGPTAWVMQPVASNALPVISAIPPGKTQFHCRVKLVLTATNRQLTARNVILAMLVREQTLLPCHHQACAHWVITALMACVR